MRTVIVCIEPSKELSVLCGFPYFIERRFTIEELLRQGIINKTDIREMKHGRQISKRIPIHKEESDEKGL